MHHSNSGKAARIPPAEHVIAQFGGVRKTARALGIPPNKVSQWRAPKERKGQGGLIPKHLMAVILDVADQQALDITGDDLIRGRKPA